MIIDVILDSDLQLRKKVYCMYTIIAMCKQTHTYISPDRHIRHTCINILTCICLEGGRSGIS